MSNWTCPVCNNPCLYNELVIYNYFFEIVSGPNLDEKIYKIELLPPDGTWRACNGK